MDLTDSQQIHGYTYANNNPITLTDPTGTRPDGACGAQAANATATQKHSQRLRAEAGITTTPHTTTPSPPTT